MEQLKQKKTSPFMGFILILMILLSSIFTVAAPIGASAEEVEEKVSVETVVENMTFITFKKGKNETDGQYIYGCFYIPDTVYDASLEYGVIVFPRWFAERYGITGNYIEEYTAIGMEESLSIMTVKKPASTNEGKILKCGIIEIPEQAGHIELAYIFFARDAEGNIAYATPQHAAYDTLLVEDYTNEQIALMIGQRIKTENSFKQIVAKLEELIDSFWTYIIMAGVAVVVVWGAVIGIRIAVARKREEQINARDMVKSLIIGIIVVFVIAVAAPMLINGLSSWLAW